MNFEVLSVECSFRTKKELFIGGSWFMVERLVTRSGMVEGIIFTSFASGVTCCRCIDINSVHEDL